LGHIARSTTMSTRVLSRVMVRMTVVSRPSAVAVGERL
jgi:hypothetical protein